MRVRGVGSSGHLEPVILPVSQMKKLVHGHDACVMVSWKSRAKIHLE